MTIHTNNRIHDLLVAWEQSKIDDPTILTKETDIVVAYRGKRVSLRDAIQFFVHTRTNQLS